MFKYIEFDGVELSPEKQGGSEPSYETVYQLFSSGKIKVKAADYVAIEIHHKEIREAIWISTGTYALSRHILAPKTVFYEAHEGVTFTSANGAFLVVGEPQPVNPPPGINEECVRVQTKLGEALGLKPFVIEKKFLFKGFKGEDVEKGYIKNYRYFIAPYDKNTGMPLSQNVLKNTLLWKNYLSNPKVLEKLGGFSSHLKSAPWQLERMRKEALAKYKVVWRDVAKEFIPAVVEDGAVPDYTVNYVVVEKPDEAYYLMAILLSPQVNAVVRELSPWVGHVQPRFLRYFRIPKYNPKNEVHRQLAQKGMEITRKRSVDNNDLIEIQNLVNKL